MRVLFRVLQVTGDAKVTEEGKTVEEAKEKVKAKLAAEKIEFLTPKSPHVITALSTVEGE